MIIKFRNMGVFDDFYKSSFRVGMREKLNGVDLRKKCLQRKRIYSEYRLFF